MANKYSQIPMGIDDKVRIVHPGDKVRLLVDLVNQFVSREWEIPSHQRGNDVWSDEKVKEWIYRLRNSSINPLGSYSTYSLNNMENNGRVWINDGLQRLSACAKYLLEPELFGDSKEVAYRVLQSIDTTIQHRVYCSHIEAAKDFQRVNQGTMLTPYEYYRAIIVYMPNYDSVWKGVLDSLHSMTENSFAFTQSKERFNRVKVHILKRDDYSMLYRMIIEESGLSRYDVSKGTPSFGEKAIKQTIEYKLVRELRDSNSSEVEERIKKLERIIDSLTSHIKDYWYGERSKSQGGRKEPIFTVHRWLAHCAIAKNYSKNIPDEVWVDFIHKILKRSGGETHITVTGKDGETEKRYAMGLGNNTQLPDMARISGSNIMEFYRRTTKRKKKDRRNARGMDESHQRSFLKYGENDTFAEPSSTNRARGSSDAEKR